MSLSSSTSAPGEPVTGGAREERILRARGDLNGRDGILDVVRIGRSASLSEGNEGEGKRR